MSKILCPACEAEIEDDGSKVHKQSPKIERLDKLEKAYDKMSDKLSAMQEKVDAIAEAKKEAKRPSGW